MQQHNVFTLGLSLQYRRNSFFRQTGFQLQAEDNLLRSFTYKKGERFGSTNSNFRSEKILQR
jgi:hypothetical protein